MQQPQNPSQEAYYHSKHPDPLSSFSINQKSPSHQPKSAFPSSTQYNSNYQPFSDDYERNSLLIQANATLSIDKQLSSGFWACYKCFLYFIIILSCCYGLLLVAFIALASQLSFLGLLLFIQILVQIVLAVITIDALKHKRLDKAQQAYKLAIGSIVFVPLTAWVQYPQAQDIWRQVGISFGSRSFFIFYSIMCYTLTVITPIWRIKLHLERRDAILKQNSDIYNL